MRLLLKDMLFTLLVPGVIVGLIPCLIGTRVAWGSIATGFWRFLAGAPAAAGLAIYLWTVWDFASKGHGTPVPLDAPRTLVINGLYRYTRNPMYMGALLVLAAWAIWFGAGALLIYGLVVFAGFNAFIVLYEEPTLRRLFGAQYDAYCASTPRWLPRLRRYL
jgi:protein-S-isoprenylcysteine O-methyltransferase Ste14